MFWVVVLYEVCPGVCAREVSGVVAGFRAVPVASVVWRPWCLGSVCCLFVGLLVRFVCGLSSLGFGCSFLPDPQLEEVSRTRSPKSFRAMAPKRRASRRKASAKKGGKRKAKRSAKRSAKRRGSKRRSRRRKSKKGGDDA